MTSFFGDEQLSVCIGFGGFSKRGDFVRVQPNVVNFHFCCAKRFSRVPEISDEGRQVYGEMSI